MTTETTPPPAVERPRRGRGLTIAGVICLILGLGVLGWSAYDVLWSPAVDPQVAAAQVSGLRERWSEPAPAHSAPAEPVTAETARATPGEAVALMRIPRFRADHELPVLAGTDRPTLRKGFGWYAGTAAPGQVGNFAVAGLGGTTGPLARIMELRPGDPIVVETRVAIHTYEVTNSPADTTVEATDTWVIQPVPGQPEVRPTEALLTLTTSQHLYRSDGRTIASARLTGTETK